MRKPYLDDLTDTEWKHIEHILIGSTYRRAGTKSKYPRREMLNAIFYLLPTGCRWRDLPHDFPPWEAVYSQFVRWKHRDIFVKIHNFVRKTLRESLGKSGLATAGIVD